MPCRGNLLRVFSLLAIHTIREEILQKRDLRCFRKKQSGFGQNYFIFEIFIYPCEWERRRPALSCSQTPSLFNIHPLFHFPSAPSNSNGDSLCLPFSVILMAIFVVNGSSTSKSIQPYIFSEFRNSFDPNCYNCISTNKAYYSNTSQFIAQTPHSTITRIKKARYSSDKCLQTFNATLSSR